MNNVIPLHKTSLRSSPGNWPDLPRRRIAVFGAFGRQGRMYSRILQAHDQEVVAFIDPQTGSETGLPSVPVYRTVDEALQKVQFDVAIVAVPHAEHFDVVSALLREGKHVIKEKPFVFSHDEASVYYRLACQSNVGLYVVSPRSYWTTNHLARHHMHRIGEPYALSYRYHLAIPHEADGWRSNRTIALGGVSLDMGYHAMDVLVRLFGKPRQVFGMGGFCYPIMANQRLEEAASLLLRDFENGTLQYAEVSLRRCDAVKEETMEILGTNGKIIVQPDRFAVYDRHGQEVWAWKSIGEHKRAEEAMLLSYLDRIEDEQFMRDELRHHLDVSDVIIACNESFYPSAGNTPVRPDVPNLGADGYTEAHREPVTLMPTVAAASEARRKQKLCFA